MRVVADSHAIVWYVQGSSRLAEGARSALVESEQSEGIFVSVAKLVDLWYVTQTTQSIGADDLSRLQAKLDASANVDLHAIDVAVADAFTLIPRTVLTDPWDRFIVATAKGAGTAVGDARRRYPRFQPGRDRLVVAAVVSRPVGRSDVPESRRWRSRASQVFVPHPCHIEGGTGRNSALRRSVEIGADLHVCQFAQVTALAQVDFPS